MRYTAAQHGRHSRADQNRNPGNSNRGFASLQWCSSPSPCPLPPMRAQACSTDEGAAGGIVYVRAAAAGRPSAADSTCMTRCSARRCVTSMPTT